jgi:hypothetical protein
MNSPFSRPKSTRDRSEEFQNLIQKRRPVGGLPKNVPKKSDRNIFALAASDIGRELVKTSKQLEKLTQRKTRFQFVNVIVNYLQLPNQEKRLMIPLPKSKILAILSTMISVIIQSN